MLIRVRTRAGNSIFRVMDFVMSVGCFDAREHTFFVSILDEQRRKTLIFDVFRGTTM